MPITAEVHIPQSACPAIGIVTDWDSLFSMVFHHGGSQWNAVGALRSGEASVNEIPGCFEPSPAIITALDKALAQANHIVNTEKKRERTVKV